MTKNKFYELGKRLEEAFRTRPIVYGFYTGGGRLLTVEQVTTAGVVSGDA